MADLLPPGEQGDIPRVETRGMCSFAELRAEGYTPFILGPVYVYAGVSWDLVQRFYEEVASKPVRDAKYDAGKGKLNVETHRLNARGAHIRFERPIVSHCPGWLNVMNLLDSESFVHFKKWILQQQFVNRAEYKFYIVRHYGAPILDPLVVDLSGQAVPTTIDVFSVCGMRGSLVPKHLLADYYEAKTFVEFQHAPPEEAVIVLGAAALKTVRES